jgi:hypothetical protein
MFKFNCLFIALFPVSMFAQVAQIDIERNIFEEQRKTSELFIQQNNTKANKGFYIDSDPKGVFSFDAEFEQDFFVPGVRVSSWPNPVFNKINLQLELKNPEVCILELTNLEGYKVIPNQKFELSAGLHNIVYDSGPLKKGTYLLNVRKPDSKGNIQLRILKQE